MVLTHGTLLTAFKLTDLEFWKAIAAWLGVISAILLTAGTVFHKTVDPLGKLAGKIADKVQDRFNESVEMVFISSVTIHEHIEEVVTENMKPVMGMLQDHEHRLERIEENTAYVKDRMVERPPRRGDKQ